jgi:hypothetical protein
MCPREEKSSFAAPNPLSRIFEEPAVTRQKVTKVFRSHAGWFVFFAAVILYSVFWGLIGRSVLNRIGYLLWLSSSAEELLNYNRITVIGILFRFIIPLIIGAVAVRWSRRCRNKIDESGESRRD